MSEQLDTFDNPSPVVDPAATAENSPQPEGLDTFDNDEVIEPDTKEEKEEVSQTESIQKDEGDKKEEKEEKEEKPKEDEKKEEKIEPKKDVETKPSKVVKIKDSNGNTTDIDAESTVKVKVKGKNEFISIEELKSNYSGQKAWTDEINSAKEKTYQAEEKMQKFETERNEIISHLTKVADILDDENKNPLDALNYIVDMTGRDAVQFNKKVMDYLSGEVERLGEMDDVEKQLYWRNKEVEQFRNNQAAKAERESATQAEMERVSKINQLRESQGVTEQQFVESHRELKSLGYEDAKITPQAIINYAVMKPSFEKAEGICADYQEDLSDDDFDTLIDTVANTLRSFPKVSEQRAIEISLDKLGWEYDSDDSDFKELNDIASRGGQQREDTKSDLAYKHVEAENHIESFDDFDDY